MADKRISELPFSTGINPMDVSVLVDNNVTQQYSFQQQLAFLALNMQLGASFTFGTGAIPSNSGGNNGDVYVKTDTGQFAQKISGIWTVVYTVVQGVVGSIIYYGSTAPSATQGINGDTYLLTTNGTFYNKIGGTWVAQFSMATGPVGPQGAAGTNGTNGVDGNTILYGNNNPSNTLGVNGNFYLNTSNYTLFGPKASGAWPAGVSIIGPPGTLPSPVYLSYSAGINLPIVLTAIQTTYSQFGVAPKIKVQKVIANGDGSYTYPDLTASATILTTEITQGITDSISISVDDNGAGKLADNIRVIISI